MKKLHLYFSFLLISILIACSSNIKYATENSSISIDTTLTNYQSATKLITPYKAALDAEMNEVLIISAEEFPKERGKSETKLGNLVADLSLEIAQDLYKDDIDFCLLNFGGLRTSLPKGKITRGKIFELMPFENELVVVTLNKEQLDQLINYLYIISPQPISKGLTLVKYEIFDGQNFIDGFSTKEKKYRTNTKFKILTSDYLANGGDKMNFFLNPIKYEPVGIKLRDAIIQYCIQENKKGNQLTGEIDGRIVFENNK